MSVFQESDGEASSSFIEYDENVEVLTDEEHTVDEEREYSEERSGQDSYDYGDAAIEGADVDYEDDGVRNAEMGDDDEDGDSKDADKGSGSRFRSKVIARNLADMGSFEHTYKTHIALINSTQTAMQFLLAADRVENSTASINRTLLVKTFIASAVAIQNNVSTDNMPAIQMPDLCNINTELMLQLISNTHTKLTGIPGGAENDAERLYTVQSTFYNGQKIMMAGWCKPWKRRKMLARIKVKHEFAIESRRVRKLINTTYHKMQKLPPPSDDDPSSWRKNAKLVKKFIDRFEQIVYSYGDIDLDGESGGGPGRRGRGYDRDEERQRGAGRYGDGKRRSRNHSSPRGGTNRDDGPVNLRKANTRHRNPSYGQKSMGTRKNPKGKWRKPNDTWRKPQDTWRKPKDTWTKPKDNWRKPKDNWRKPKDNWRKPKDNWRKPKDNWRKSSRQW